MNNANKPTAIVVCSGEAVITNRNWVASRVSIRTRLSNCRLGITPVKPHLQQPSANWTKPPGSTLNSIYTQKTRRHLSTPPATSILWP